AGLEPSCLGAAVIAKQASGQAVTPGEEPDVRSTDGVIDGVPAAVAALEDRLGANAIEMLSKVAQHCPLQIDATAARPLRNDPRKGPGTEYAQVMHDKL